MIEWSIKNNGMSLKFNHIICNGLDLYAKVVWQRVLKFVKLVPFRSKPSLEASTKLGAQEMSFVSVRI